MIKVSVMYPNGADSTFDMMYTNITPTIQISEVKMSHVVAAATVEA